MLEANADTIRAEMHRALLTDVRSRSAHDASLVSRGCWSEHVLLTGGPGVVHHGNRCPQTTALLLRIPELVACAHNGVGEAIFSVLAPKTHLRPHCASSNLRLTCHLPLVVPDAGCRLRCGKETRPWVAGKCLCFDDSFEHEVRTYMSSCCARLLRTHVRMRSRRLSQAFNDSDETRIILLLNFYHPALPTSEWKPLCV